MQLRNLTTGKLENVPDDGIAQALAAGTHMPEGGDRYLLSPDGQLGLMPENLVNPAITHGGYKVPTQDQLQEFANRARYDTGAGEAKAFGLGALRGASFGLSDLALTRGLGAVMKPQDIAGYKSYNPVSSVTGEVAGAVGSALLAPEASPAGLVSKLGTGIAEGVAGEGAGLLARIGGRALGGAAEGAIYGATPSISEAALGDPDAMGERLIANVGLGALLGGALGGAFETGRLAIPKSVETAEGAVSGGWKKLFGTPVGPGEQGGILPPKVPPEEAELLPGDTSGAPTPPSMTAEGAAGPMTAPPTNQAPADAGLIPKIVANAKEAMSGKPAQETLDEFAQRHGGGPGGKAGERMSLPEFEDFERQFGGDLQATHDATEQMTRDVNEARPLEKASLLEHMPPVEAATHISRVAGAIRETAEAMRAEADSFSMPMTKDLEKIAATLERSASDSEASAGDHYLALDEAKKRLNELSDPKVFSGKAYVEEKTAKTIRELFHDAKMTLIDPDKWGEAAARQAEYNEAITQHIENTAALRKAFFVKQNKFQYNVSPTKVRQFLNNIKNYKAEPALKALRDYYGSASDMIQQVKQVYKVAPYTSFDQKSIETLLNKSMKQMDRGMNVIKASDMGHGGIQNILTLAAAGYFGGPLGAAGALAKILGEAAVDPVKLAMIEKMAGKTSSTINKSMKAIFKPLTEKAGKGLGVMAEKLSPAEKLEKIKGKIEETQDHVNSPENLADTLGKATEHGVSAAPHTMASVQNAAIRGLQFLQGKIPANPQTTPFEEKLEPNQDQLEAFEHYHRVIHDPLSVLDELKSGMLHPESVEALASVYPHLYQEMQQAAIEHVASIKDRAKIPYSTRQTLSQFMGAPLDQSLTPQAIQAAQGALAMQTAQKNAERQQAGKPTVKGMEHLNVAMGAATDFQRTSMQERRA